jgi:O-succinylbenzoic acid--CoA ligase
MISIGDIFLQTVDKEYSYDDLFHFASSLRFSLSEIEITSEKPIGIVATPNDSTILTIACCWIMNIPFVMYPTKATPEEIAILSHKVSISGLIGSMNFDFPEPVKIFQMEGMNKESNQAMYENIKHNLNLHSYPSDLFGYFFTSGTTNFPKTVPIKRKNIIAAARSSLMNIPMNANDLWLHVLPLHHIGGISIITRALLSGSGLFYLPEFNAELVSKIFKLNAHIKGASLVPTQLRRLFQFDDLKVKNSFKAVLLGGGPISEELIGESRGRGIPVIPSFGMTETSAQCIAMPLSDCGNGPAYSCGKPLQGIDVQLRPDSDSDGSFVLWLRGDQIFDGYLEQHLNAEAFDNDGWFNTGDYATIDEKGYLSIIMRRSDRIVSGGENINPVEIENLLLSYPGIKDIAVVGLPDSEWGQITTAAVVLSNDRQLVTINNLKSFLSQKISPFKIPKQLFVVSEIPRTASGKIKRYELLKDLTTK